jgi:hypothetical protein
MIGEYIIKAVIIDFLILNISANLFTHFKNGVGFEILVVFLDVLNEVVNLSLVEVFLVLDVLEEL